MNEKSTTPVDRTWFLTWTTYGTWLPGDNRGFVSRYKNENGDYEIHNEPSTAYDAGLPRLKRAAERQLKGEPVRLNSKQASILLKQFLETASYRKWTLFATTIWQTAAIS